MPTLARDGRCASTSIPQFDVFRRLDPAESRRRSASSSAPSASRSSCPPETDPLARGWRAFAAAWSRAGGGRSRSSRRTRSRPSRGPRGLGARVAATAGRDALRAGRSSATARVTDDATLRFGETRVPRDGSLAVVYVVRHPATDGPGPRLDRRRRRGRAARVSRASCRTTASTPSSPSQGDAPDNVVKGQWPALGLAARRCALERTRTVARRPRRAADAGTAGASRAGLRSGAADGARRFLADDDAARARRRHAGARRGGATTSRRALRGGGPRARRRRRLLVPDLEEPDGPDGKPVTLRNVVGVLPGHEARVGGAVGGGRRALRPPRPRLARRARRATRARSTTARTTTRRAWRCCSSWRGCSARELKPERGIVFVAFSGEEWGLQGLASTTRERCGRWPASQAIGDDQPRHRRPARGQEAHACSAPAPRREWRHIAMGVGFTTGRRVELRRRGSRRAATRRASTRRACPRCSSSRGRTRTTTGRRTTSRRSTRTAWSRWRPSRARAIVYLSAATGAADLDARAGAAPAPRGPPTVPGAA